MYTLAEKGVSLLMMQTLPILSYMYMKRHLLKLDYLFCIVLVCSEPQQSYKYIEYLKSIFYNHIYFSNKINETRCNS